MIPSVGCKKAVLRPFDHLAMSGVVVDVLDRGRPDDDRPLRPVAGIGAHGNVVQIVLKSSHGIQRLGGRPLFRGPSLGRRFLRGGGAGLRLGCGFGGPPTLGHRRRHLAPRCHDLVPLLRDVSFPDHCRRRRRLLLGRRGLALRLCDVLLLGDRRWCRRLLLRRFAPLRWNLPFFGHRHCRRRFLLGRFAPLRWTLPLLGDRRWRRRVPLGRRSFTLLHRLNWRRGGGPVFRQRRRRHIFGGGWTCDGA